MELGDIATRALGKLDCSQRKVQWAGNRIQSAECPSYALPPAPEETGTLSVTFDAERVVEIRWEQRLSDAPLGKVVQLHQRLSQKLRIPQYSNTEEEEMWPSALARGEWHHRWGLGNGVFFSWFARVDDFSLGNTREPTEPQYAWVLMAKHKPYE